MTGCRVSSATTLVTTTIALALRLLAQTAREPSPVLTQSETGGSTPSSRIENRNLCGEKPPSSSKSFDFLGRRRDAENAQRGAHESPALISSANLSDSAPLRQNEPALGLSAEAQLGIVGLAGGLAVAIHPQALFAMLALPLLAQPGRRLRDLAILLVTGAVAPLLTFLVLVMLGVPLPTLGNGYVGDNRLFWTWSEFANPGQLADAWANLWLLVPAAPVLLLIGLLVLLAPKPAPVPAPPPTLPDPRRLRPAVLPLCLSERPGPLARLGSLRGGGAGSHRLGAGDLGAAQ